MALVHLGISTTMLNILFYKTEQTNTQVTLAHFAATFFTLQIVPDTNIIEITAQK